MADVSKEVKAKISPEEVVRRLRSLRQPIRYYGESDSERVGRLRQLELMEHERVTGASKGRMNERVLAAAEVEKELEAAMAQGMLFA